MCGNGKCVYYGCDTCGKVTSYGEDVLRLTRDECDCLNELRYEFCSQECLAAYLRELDCTCGSKNTVTVQLGPSDK